MKKVYSSLLCVAAISLASVQVGKAQTPTPGALALKPPAGAVTIDGMAQEWGDSLSYYNAEKKIHYTIANDKTNIYLVVKTKNPVEQNDIMTSGITFSIDPKGRKRSPYSTTFPSATSGGPDFSIKGSGEETPQQKAMRASLTRLKKIKVDGFKDIDDESVGTTNNYAIQIAMNIDDKGYLVYEEALPIALFHADALLKNEWSFNIKINGIEKPSNDMPSASEASASTSGGGGKGGRGGGGGGGGARKMADPSLAIQSQAQNTPSIDFWGKFSLSPVN